MNNKCGKMAKIPYIKLINKSEIINISDKTSEQKFKFLFDTTKNKTLSHTLSKDKKTKTRFFIQNENLCEFAPRSSRSGNYSHLNYMMLYEYAVFDHPLTAEEKDFNKKAKSSNTTIKYKNEAMSSTFENKFIMCCKNADITKSPYVNKITAGCNKDGEFISVERVRKALKTHYEGSGFIKALKNKSDFKAFGCLGGYDLHVELKNNEHGVFSGWISLYYKGTLNGHEYCLISDKNFAFVETD